jgi:GWxTD domain-containing protein
MGNSLQFLHGIAALVIMVILPGASLHAQEDAVWIDLLRFQGQEAPYFEIQLEFESNAFVAKESANGWQTTARFEATLENADGIINYAKTTIAGPLEADSVLAVAGTQLHIERMEAPSGDYRINVVLDDNSVEGTFSTASNLGLTLPRTDSPRWSDSFIVEAYAPSDTNRPSQLTRSGFDMLPVVGGRVGAQADRIQFYAELYGVQDVVDSLFLVSCWIQNEEGQIEPGTQRYFRKVAREVVPIFTSIPTADITLKSNSMLIIQAATKENEIIAQTQLPLDVQQPLSSDFSWDYADGNYLREFTDSLALIQHVRDHRPRADASQRHTIEGFLNVATVKQMQAFLLSFWEEQATSNPELGWREYTTAIAYADSSYGACRKGHGAETDMGSIYLHYGPPNTIIKRHNETDYYPYEIWHYHRAGAFTNKRFLFFSPHMVAECFVLLHSDMLGEVQNSDWLHQLRNRENRLRVTDSQLNRLNPRRDTFSGEEPEDLFFNPR